jgi:hypothetical protein
MSLVLRTTVEEEEIIRSILSHSVLLAIFFLPVVGSKGEKKPFQKVMTV